MPRTPLMQRLLRLTSLARNAKNKQVNETEFAENYFSRRKFLQTSSMAAVAAAALASCTKLIETSPKESSGDDSNGNTTNPSITIIGAGIAGLNAAFNLQNEGISSTIYDANTRAGGRMFTAQNILNPGLSTELGGEFIDSDHHEMQALAEYFGLPLIDLYSSSELKLTQNIYFFNGITY